MKKKIVSLAIATLFVLNLAAPAFADSTPVGSQTAQNTQVETAKPSILPDSPLYPVKELVEKIVLTFTTSPDKKAQRLLDNANDRLAEAQAMADKGKQDLATETAQKYVDTVEKAQIQVTIAIDDGKVTGSVGEAVYGQGKNKDNVVATVYGMDLSERHAAQVLVRVLAKAPEAARKGLTNALENVLKHQADQNEVITILINGQQVKDDEISDARGKQAADKLMASIVGNQETFKKLRAQGFTNQEITAIIFLSQKAKKSVDEIAQLYLDQHKDLTAVIKALGLPVEATAKEINAKYKSIKRQLMELFNLNKPAGQAGDQAANGKVETKDNSATQAKDNTITTPLNQAKPGDKVNKEKRYDPITPN